jgi:UDP-N-acetylmuramate dehydrogenase
MIREFVSLKAHNTFGIESEARYFASFENEQELLELLSTPEAAKEKRLILGGGSNLLFTRNFDGIVMHNRMKGIEVVDETEDYYFVKSYAGEIWHSFVMHCIEKEFAGVENLALIPGFVGASPMQNIGAYGVEIKDIFDSLEAMHIREKKKKTFSLTECNFGYRESVFKREEKDEWIIMSVTYRLRKRPVLNTTYGAIEEELDKMKLDKITIADVARAVIQIRSSKLPDPRRIGNAGSFFKNPVVPIEVYKAIQENHNNAPCFPVNDREVKVPAGWLIERAGWKGKNMGQYGVHANQALVLVNYGGATGKEIYDLSSDIIADIQSKFGVTLEREVNII